MGGFRTIIVFGNFVSNHPLLHRMVLYVTIDLVKNQLRDISKLGLGRWVDFVQLLCCYFQSSVASGMVLYEFGMMMARWVDFVRRLC